MEEQAGAIYLARFPSFANLRDCVPGGSCATADAFDLIQTRIAPGIVNIQDLCKHWNLSANHAYARLRRIREAGLMNVERLGKKNFMLTYVNQ